MPEEQTQPVSDPSEEPAESAVTVETASLDAPASVAALPGTPEAPEVQGPVNQEELAEARANEVAFSWQASEYVHHHKGTGWYAGLAGLMLVLVGLAVWLKLWLSIAAFLAMGAAIIVYARRPPRTLLYELDQTGILVEGKHYPYSDFRSFGVLKDTEWHTIDLEPVKRFSPRLSILFDEDDFDAIVDHLELHLPRSDREPDLIEKVSRIVRF